MNTRCSECGSMAAGSSVCDHCGSSLLDDNEPRGAYFPLQFFVDFLRYIAARPDRFQVITYDDFHWSSQETYPSDYKKEYFRWQTNTRRSTELRGKAHILLQHDVDSRAERTMALLRYQEEIRIRSNCMIFAERIDRKRLKHDGSIRTTEYLVDHNYLSSLESERWVVGYHCNAFERAMFDSHKAQAIFEADLRELRQRYTIRYFSPHGGVPASDGRNNNSIEVPQSLRNDIIWVHNKNSARFDASYSDGGINNPSRDPEQRNLIRFVESFKPGGRYRILTHPQYYDPIYREAPVLMQSRWYQELLGHYRASPSVSLWEKALG